MKMQIAYKPDAADRREWVVDRENPSWDIVYATEKATDWGWLEFLERLDGMSAIAWRALLWTLRKRDEPRLRLEYVEIDDWNDLRVEIQCPACEEWINAANGAHECTFPEPEDETGIEGEGEAAEVGEVPEA